MTPPPGRARVPALAVVALLLATGLAGCGMRDSLGTQRCTSYDELRARTATDGLRVAPEVIAAGGMMTVGRSDDEAVHPGPVFLHGDANAGCRVYALLPPGDEPAWTDITDEDACGLITTYAGPRTTAAIYPVPESAAPGSYLLCGLNEKVGEAQLCRAVTLAP